MSQFIQPDHSLGDANTIGGYMAVHARPAAFEGADGASYSVEIVSDESGDAAQPFAAYLLFVRWRAGDPVAAGHLESEYLAFANTEAEAMARVGSMKLGDVRALLDDLISKRREADKQTSAAERKWWDAMREENEGEA